MSATARQEREMKMKYEHLKDKKNVCPIELLQAFVFSQGVRNFKNLSRYENLGNLVRSLIVSDLVLYEIQNVVMSALSDYSCLFQVFQENRSKQRQQN